jgi:hypothetical protein
VFAGADIGCVYNSGLGEDGGGAIIFLFLNQQTRNKIPTSNAGPAIDKDQNNINHWGGGFVKMVINNLEI